MPRKPADMRSALQSSAKSPPRSIQSTGTDPEEDLQKAIPENPHYRPGRAKKSNVTGYFDPAVKKQLRQIAADEDTTIQSLLAEGLNDVFAKRNRPEIAKAE